jgi:large subunit ribosomal protein L21
MYAVIKTGGKQYAVEPGDRLFVEKLDVEQGAKIEFDRVLYLNTDDSVKVGTPYLDAVRVLGTVVENGKGQKVIIFKYKAKKDYRKKRGHRQPYTLVEIDAIAVDGTVISKPVTRPEEAPAQEISDAAPEEPETPASESVAAAEEASEPAETEQAREEKSADAEAEIPAEKPAARRTAKPKAEKPEDENAESPAEKPAAKRTVKPRAAKPEAEKAESEAEKPAARRTAKPKAEKPEAENSEAGAEKPEAKRTAKPKDTPSDAAPAASEEPEEEK